MFFIQGVSALVAEAFGKRKYGIHIFDEKQIMNIMPASDVMSRIFVFSDTKNPLLLFYLNLFFGVMLLSEAVVLRTSGSFSEEVEKSNDV